MLENFGKFWPYLDFDWTIKKHSDYFFNNEFHIYKLFFYGYKLISTGGIRCLKIWL